MNIFIALLFLSKCRNKLKCLSAGLIHLHKDMIFISSNDTGWDEVKEASYKERHSHGSVDMNSPAYTQRKKNYTCLETGVVVSGTGNQELQGFTGVEIVGKKLWIWYVVSVLNTSNAPPFAHIRWGNCLVGLSPVTWMPGIRPDWLLGDPTVVTDAKQSTVSCEGNLCEQLHGICVGTNQERKWGEAAREKVGLKRCADEVVLRSCWLCFAVG